jgi:hypothetical protein
LERISISVDYTYQEVSRMTEGLKSFQLEKGESQPYKIRLPAFITNENIGLGDVLKRATASFGIKPCGGCQRRASVLNRQFVFSGGTK